MFTVDTDKFYVISVCFNPIRYVTRYNLFEDFRKHMQDLGAQLITVEIAFGDRPFILTEPRNKHHLQIRTNQELWHKEAAINLAIHHLCRIDSNWQYVAWIDGDIHFHRSDIVLETVHQLQHYDIVQMFSHVVDLSPRYEPISQQNGFVWSYVENGFKPPQGPGWTPPTLDPYSPYTMLGKKGGFWHCGYAWAARRSALEKISLFDQAILGSADHHMAMGLIGLIERSVPTWVSRNYRNALITWQEIAELQIRRNIGYVSGTISHYWHGKKADRKYVDRWKILQDSQYDPLLDISRDIQGLYRLNIHGGMRSIRLRDEIRQYFRARNEDSIDVG